MARAAGRSSANETQFIEGLVIKSQSTLIIIITTINIRVEMRTLFCLLHVKRTLHHLRNTSKGCERVYSQVSSEKETKYRKNSFYQSFLFHFNDKTHSNDSSSLLLEKATRGRQNVSKCEREDSLHMKIYL